MMIVELSERRPLPVSAMISPMRNTNFLHLLLLVALASLTLACIRREHPNEESKQSQPLSMNN